MVNEQIVNEFMAKMIVDAAGISTISGAMLKPKKIEGHNHGNYLVAVHRVAPTTNPNCQRIYSKRPDAYKRSTPVSADERAQRQRFGAICQATQIRKKNLSTIAADLEAFNAQKDTGYKTFYQYLWHICAAEIDG
jgi:hypothetical protein